MVDLHAHSTFSDGSLSPEELVALGASLGLTGMVLTDHDTLAGSARFLTAAAAKEIRALSGVELSVEVPGATIHMLAYGCDLDNAPLNEALDRVRAGRHRRNIDILSKLSRNGCPLAWSDVLAFAGEDALVTRPHFAQVLVKKGYARSKADAFDRYLAKGAVAYAERFRLAPKEAIRLIAQAGGVSVLAHPSRCGLTDEALRDWVGDMARMGLGGIEAYYTGHSAIQVATFFEYAQAFGLIVTGGSDFHGAMSPNIQLGTAYGSLRVPDECLDALEARIAAARAHRASQPR